MPDRNSLRKVVITEAGDADVLKVVRSDPPAIGPGQVLVDVHAAGVNYLDIYQRKGEVAHPTPFTPGFEGVGVVRRVGGGVLRLKPGTRVAWINSFGSYADQIALPEEQAITVPASFAVEQTLLFQGVTAQYLLSEYRQVKPGDVVLVHAAAGGVGQLLVQWLKHLGAVVIGTASSAEKLRAIQALGADHAINYSDGHFLKPLLDVTNGRGVDLALDAVGATTFSETVKALAPRGTAISYGQASGRPPDVEVLPLVLKGARVAGASLFVYIQNAEEMQRRAAEVIRAIQAGWLRLEKTTNFALDEVAGAHRALESRSTQGKLALITNGDY
jgi:NADPH:quinone reductase